MSLFINPHQNGVKLCRCGRLARAIGTFWMGAYSRRLVVRLMFERLEGNPHIAETVEVVVECRLEGLGASRGKVS
jgi:hypothetical protein